MVTVPNKERGRETEGWDGDIVSKFRRVILK